MIFHDILQNSHPFEKEQMSVVDLFSRMLRLVNHSTFVLLALMTGDAISDQENAVILFDAIRAQLNPVEQGVRILSK